MGNLRMMTSRPNPREGEGVSIRLALSKLIDVIEEENAVLQDHRIILHTCFTDRKNQGLRELMAAQRSDDPGRGREACKNLLERLSSALRVNASLLKLHIGAVGEMSDIIISGLREAESDGTYCRNRQMRG
jgi:hypothetical protein